MQRVFMEEPTLLLDRQIICGDYSFAYFVRSGAWPELLERLDALRADHFILVTDETFPRALAEEARSRIATVGDCALFTIPSGEAAKSLATVEQLSVMAEEEVGITTASCIIALGGGLVANIAGYWAATQFRGIRLVQLPTTLLSMADVMPSLKQGVNTARGKNHLGAYYPPVFVWNDLSYLATLPTIEIQSALCEMIKFMLTIPPRDARDYEAAIAALRPDGQYTQAQLFHFIRICLDAKSAILRDDPFEKGEGLIFEYGHTIGHALELLSCQQGYRPIPHGLAVGLGMLVAARVSRLLGMLTPDEESYHVRLLQRNGSLLAIPPELPVDEIMRLVAHDNKKGRLLPLPAGRHNMVLLRHLHEPDRTGGTVLTQVEEGYVREAIEAYRG